MSTTSLAATIIQETAHRHTSLTINIIIQLSAEQANHASRKHKTKELQCTLSARII